MKLICTSSSRALLRRYKCDFLAAAPVGLGAAEDEKCRFIFRPKTCVFRPWSRRAQPAGGGAGPSCSPRASSLTRRGPVSVRMPPTTESSLPVRQPRCGPEEVFPREIKSAFIGHALSPRPCPRWPGHLAFAEHCHAATTCPSARCYPPPLGPCWSAGDRSGTLGIRHDVPFLSDQPGPLVPSILGNQGHILKGSCSPTHQAPPIAPPGPAHPDATVCGSEPQACKRGRGEGAREGRAVGFTRRGSVGFRWFLGQTG